jgi:biotin synthase
MGETIDDRVSVAFSLKELNPSVVPLNFLNPIAGTPLADSPRLSPMEILQTVAVMRLVLPRQDLKVAGGREKNLRDLQSWIFYVGATSALIGNYLATYGRPHAEDMQMVRRFGLGNGTTTASETLTRHVPLPEMPTPAPVWRCLCYPNGHGLD